MLLFISSCICTYSECFKSENVMLLASPGYNQNWIYDFLSDWLTQNQNIDYTAKGLGPGEMVAMSHRKPLQRYSWFDRILPANYRSLDFKNSRKIPPKSRFLYFSLLELRDTQKLANYKLLSATLFTTSSRDVGCLIFSIQESEKSERYLISCICTLNKA